MSLASKRNIKLILEKHKIKPSKRLGQNFLIDKSALKKILKAAGLNSNDIVLEIGPGLGTLTVELAKIAKKVVAVEKDSKMAGLLKKTLAGSHNVEVVENDILDFKTNVSEARLKNPAPPKTESRLRAKSDRQKLCLTTYKIVANLPYYIASAVIRKFLETENPPEEMVLMVQKEVGQRIVALPPNMNLLAASVQFYAKAEIISYVLKKSFWPQPKVDSAIIKIVPCQFRAKASPRFRELFFSIVKAGFSQPRKQLLNNLSKELKLTKDEIQAWLLKNKIRANQRAESLSIQDWINLAESYKNFAGRRN